VKSAIALLSLFLSSSVYAAGLSTADRSVVAMGTGGAAVARADDPGANVYNPASVVFAPGLELSLGALLAAPKLEASGESWTAATAGGASVPPHLHLRYATDTFALGASFTVPFGSEVRWPDDWERRFDVVSARLKVLRVSGFGAYKFGSISVAAGPFVDFGSLALDRAIDFIDAEGKTSIETHSTSLGALAAVFFRATEELDLGLSYQSRSSLSLTGYADFDVPPELRGKASDQAVNAKLMLPDRLTAGALYRVNEELDLAFDLEVLLWSTVDELRIDFANEDMTDVSQRRDWSATVTPRIGATYRALSWLELRGGAFLDPSPVPEETVGPSSPDSTRIGLTLGAGAEYKGFAFDLGYQLLMFTGSTSKAEDLEGVSFGGSAHLVGLSLGYRAAL
jgi:long-chain fatty acid transport protein